MKKLVVLLASAMMFSFSATAFAFTDMDDQTTTVSDAVAKAVALEIIEGYEDDTYRPDATITRAEFAKIAVTAAGAASTATMLEDTASEFSDVTTGAWYTGWINAAASLGLVQGADGAYRPNETITNAEVITVLMRLLGYNDNLTGTWPTNYVTQANKLEVLDNVTVSANAAATRADVAVVLDAVLSEDMVKYSKDTETFEEMTKTGTEWQYTYDDDGVTVISQQLVSAEYSYTLLSDSFGGNTVSDARLSYATLKDAEDLTFWINTTETSYRAEADVVIDSAASLLTLSGHNADIIYKYIDDKAYVQYVDITSTKIVTSDVDYTDGDSYVTVDGKKYTLDGCDPDYVVNTLGKNSKFTVYVNDDDMVYSVSSDITSTVVSSFIEEVDEEEVTTLNALVDGDTTFEYDADLMVIVDNATGAFITPDDLEAGMVLKNYYNQDDVLIAYEAVTGDFTKMATDSKTKYTFGGTAYATYGGAEFFDQEWEEVYDFADYLGEEVTYFVNSDNTVTEVITGDMGTAAILYGVIVDASSTSGSLAGSDVSDVTIFTEEGKTVTYELTSDGLEGYDDVTAGANLDGNDNDGKLGAFVAYKLNSDGEIKAMYDESTDFVDLGTDVVEVVSSTYLNNGTTYTLSSDVVIFNIGEDDGDLEVTIITRAELLDTDDFQAVDVDLDVKADTDELVAYLTVGKITGSSIKVMAGTEIVGSTSLLYGVIDSIYYEVSDNDYAVSIVGDDNDYEIGDNSAEAAADQVVAYKISGNTLTIDSVVSDDEADEYSEFNYIKYSNDGVYTTEGGYVVAIVGEKTEVFVMDEDGDFTPGDLSDLKTKVYAVAVGTPVNEDDSDEYSRAVLVVSSSNYEEYFATQIADAADAAAALADAQVVAEEYIDAINDTVLLGEYLAAYNALVTAVDDADTVTEYADAVIDYEAAVVAVDTAYSNLADAIAAVPASVDIYEINVYVATMPDGVDYYRYLANKSYTDVTTAVETAQSVYANTASTITQLETALSTLASDLAAVYETVTGTKVG